MKIITALSMKPRKGFFVDLDNAECAVTVTPNEGDVLLHEGYGRGRLNGVSIPGSKITEFEADRVEGGFGIRIWFRGRSGRTFHDIGVTEDPVQAKAWVDAVNQIYVRERSKSEEAAEHPFRLGKFRANPAIHDVLEKRENIILPGTYLYSEDPQPPNFPMSWREFREAFPFNACYVEQANQRLLAFAKVDFEIQNRILSPPSHDYSWLANRIRYRKKQFLDRVTQPLEIVFDREERREDVAVLQAGIVERFAVVYWKDRYPAQRLLLRPGEQIAASLGQWLEKINEADTADRRIVVLTPAYQSVDYSMQDAIAKRQLADSQRKPAPTVGVLADWLWAGANYCIVACDIGVAFQLLTYLRSEHGVDRKSVDIAFVPYERPISVGPCYRVDDPEWGLICNSALNYALRSSDPRVQEDLGDMRSRAARIGVEWPVAA